MIGPLLASLGRSGPLPEPPEAANAWLQYATGTSLPSLLLKVRHSPVPGQ